MLTVMCPNCRHRFPAPGCCDPQTMDEETTTPPLIHPTTCYYGGLLVPKGYTSGGGCFINAPTIIHSQPIINSFNYAPPNGLEKPRIDKPKDRQIFGFPLSSEQQQQVAKNPAASGCQITTSCELTGGSVTITTPSIQSGGCLIQSTDSGSMLQSPRAISQIRPNLSGGGCFVQKTLSTDNHEASGTPKSPETFLVPPSGCQELPGTRRNQSPQKQQEQAVPTCTRDLEELQNEDEQQRKSLNKFQVLLDSNPGMQIQVNATLQLPASLGQCTVNITATAANSPNSPSSSELAFKSKNNFNGGGLVQKSETAQGEENFEEGRTPTTPVSWLMPMPCPWSFDNYVMDRDAARLSEVKRLLQTCGWYHEGLSWQQSESLLKNAPVGRWLMRDSSDSRYMFAVSVQTARGPTSVRVHYFLGQFRLDAEPRLAFTIPLFDCPIKMLEYYVEYSKSVDEHRKEVWVDYSGQLYSEIYLTKPLVKEVRSLSHLARLVVNRSKLNTEHLPPLIRNYLAEYPYAL